MPALLPLSRDIAARLLIDASPAGAGRDRHEAEASSVRLLLVLLSRAAARVHEGQDADARVFDRLAYEYSNGISYEPLWAGLKPLREDLGRIQPSSLLRDLSRAAGMLVSLWGEESEYQLMAPLARSLTTPEGRVPRARAEVGRFRVEKTLLAAAGVDEPVDEHSLLWFDPRVMARFSSRYSPLAYVRVLAWLSDTHIIPGSWGAHVTSKGTLAFVIPSGEIAEALGTCGMVRAPRTPGGKVGIDFDRIERTVFKPVIRDLRHAGLKLTVKIERSKKGVALRARLWVERDESVRPLPARKPRASRRTRRGAQRPAQVAAAPASAIADLKQPMRRRPRPGANRSAQPPLRGRHRPVL